MRFVLLGAAIGVKMTGVDNTTYSLTGQAYSHICAPKTESTAARVLQKDDVSLAYEFSRKFPGYTSDNLTEKGVHEVKLPHLIQPIDSSSL